MADAGDMTVVFVFANSFAAIFEVNIVELTYERPVASKFLLWSGDFYHYLSMASFYAA